MKKNQARFIEEFETAHQKLMDGLGECFWESIRHKVGEGTSRVSKNDYKLTPEDEANECREANDRPQFDETPALHDHFVTITLELFDQALHSYQNLFNTSSYIVTGSGAQIILHLILPLRC